MTDQPQQQELTDSIMITDTTVNGEVSVESDIVTDSDSEFIDFIKEKLNNLKIRLSALINADEQINDEYKEWMFSKVDNTILYLLAPSSIAENVPNVIALTFVVLKQYYNVDEDQFLIDKLLLDQLRDVDMILGVLNNQPELDGPTEELKSDLTAVQEAFRDETLVDLVEKCKLVCSPYLKMFCQLYLNNQ